MPRHKPKKPLPYIVKDPTPDHDPDLSRFGNAARWAGDALEKLDALKDHYGIDRDNDNETQWMMLALRLAAERYPNQFAPKFPKKKRKVDRRSIARDAWLYILLVDAEGSGKPVTDRVRFLAKNAPAFKGANPETLRKRYIKLKKENTPEGKRLREYIRSLQENPSI